MELNGLQHVLVFCFLIEKLQANVASEAKVSMKENVTGNIGSNNTSLVCKYAADNLKYVEILGKYRTADTFKVLATFRPGKKSILSPYETHLTNRRIVLTNITETSTEAVIRFKNLKCIDEGQYKCAINFFSGIPQQLTSSPISLYITVPPPDPEPVKVYIYNSSEEIDLTSTYLIEGDTITIQCIGNIGRPPGKIFWQQSYNNTVVRERNLTGIDTSIIENSELCTNYQNSSLTIQVTAEDHLKKIRCNVQSSLSVTETFVESTQIKVYFMVRTPNISIIRPHKSIQQKYEDIKLICKSRGNPPPNYEWYKSDNMSKVISPNSTYIIADASVNKTGLYICRVSNVVNKTLYQKEASVNITMDTTRISSDGCTNAEFGIDLGLGNFDNILITLAPTLSVRLLH